MVEENKSNKSKYIIDKVTRAIFLSVCTYCCSKFNINNRICIL